MAEKVKKISMSVFKITGSFKKGKSSQKFTKELIVEDKEKASEHILSIMGSKHKVKRREITIDKIEKVALDKVTDPIIKQMIGGK